MFEYVCFNSFLNDFGNWGGPANKSYFGKNHGI